MRGRIGLAVLAAMVVFAGGYALGNTSGDDDGSRGEAAAAGASPIRSFEPEEETVTIVGLDRAPGIPDLKRTRAPASQPPAASTPAAPAPTTAPPPPPPSEPSPSPSEEIVCC